MAATGESVIVAMGSSKKLPFSLDDLHFIPSQVTRIPLNREDGVNTEVFIGPLDAQEIIDIKPGEKDILNKIVKIAEFFLNARGTAFEPALSQALEFISKQSFKKADGQAPIALKVLAEFLENYGVNKSSV